MTVPLPRCRLRPELPAEQKPGRPLASVLVAGVVLSDRPNNAAGIVANLAASKRYSVSQLWAEVGASRASQLNQRVICFHDPQLIPKYVLINRLLSSVQLSRYEYLVICDDDIDLPLGFLDDFLELQRHLDFRLAQPARTSDSYIDHPLVERRAGVLARQTWFVECGPLVSLHASIYDLMLPFELESPMGWGYENIWSYRLGQRGLKMGIIDGIPVGHRMRAPGSHYDTSEAREGKRRLLRAYSHRPDWECFKTLETVFNLDPISKRPEPSFADPPTS